MDVTGWLVITVVPAGVAALTGSFAGWQAGRRSVRAAARDRRKATAGALRNGLHDLHDLVWNRLIGVEVTSDEVATAMVSFEGLCRRHEDLLPDDAGHLRRSTRQAMAHVFGGPASAALHDEAKAQPIDELESYWADITSTWLEHAARRLHAWEDSPALKRLGIAYYEHWRRDEDGEYRMSLPAGRQPPGGPRPQA